MRTLQYTVDGALLRTDTGLPVVVGNLVRLFLDTEAVPSFPEFVYGTIQHPLVSEACDTQTVYHIEYDEGELGGVVGFLRVFDVVSLEYYGTVAMVESVGLSMPNIFSVSGSPVTSSGTLAVTLVSQSQRLFLGSPNSGSGAPTFRTIQGSDIANLATSHITGLSAALEDFEARVTSAEDTVAGFDIRITAAEATIEDHEARITDFELMTGSPSDVPVFVNTFNTALSN